MIKIIDGNLLNTQNHIIAHQVNCKKKMGSGVALHIKNAFPEVYEKYMLDEPKLGRVEFCETKDGRIIANMYAQDDYGYDGKQYTNVEALSNCLDTLGWYCILTKCRAVALPYKIGCGRGGADWERVYKIIEETLVSKNIEVELWRLEE